MEKACPECGEKLRGRTDKKFCSDYCRNSHHNKVNKETSNLIRNTNNLLRRNHRILEELNPLNKTSVPRKKLLSKGFDFEFFTNIYTTKTGKQYFFVYDQGYLKLDNDFYALVKRD
jgi:dipeptidase